MPEIDRFKKHTRGNIFRRDREIDNFSQPLLGRHLWTPRDYLIRPLRFPAADILEDKKKITLTAEIPGVEAGDLDITLDGRMLTIKGEKKQEKENTEDNFHRAERSFGRFQRTIELPAKVDHSKVEASCKRGVLRIELKKAEESLSKKIGVK